MLQFQPSLLLIVSTLLSFAAAAFIPAGSAALPAQGAFAASLQFQPVFFPVLQVRAVFQSHRHHPDH